MSGIESRKSEEVHGGGGGEGFANAHDEEDAFNSVAKRSDEMQGQGEGGPDGREGRVSGEGLEEEEEFGDNWSKVASSFEEMGLNEKLLRGIFSLNYEKPSAIQARGILAIFEGRDVIGQAQSGTGKTATYVIGILNRLKEDLREVQALILAPTHELAIQIDAFVKKIGHYMKVVSMCCIGGRHVMEDVKQLRLLKPQVIIGTPGRIFHLLNDQHLNPQHISVFVLDEADEMLSKDFFEPIRQISYRLYNDVQLLLFSATLPEPIKELAKSFMTDPIRLLMNKEELTLEGIKQYCVQLDDDKTKLYCLVDIYQKYNIGCAVIFCNFRRKVEKVSEFLIKCNFAVGSIHSDLNSKQRDEIMNNFRIGKTRVLVTTDLLSRGIDVQAVSLVINYDIPQNVEVYLHRIGRSGRFGRKGIAINFVMQSDQDMVHAIESFYNTQIVKMPKVIAELSEPSSASQQKPSEQQSSSSSHPSPYSPPPQAKQPSSTSVLTSPAKFTSE